MTMAENVAAQAQLLVEQEQRIARIEERVETALTAIARPSGDTWVEDMKAAIAGYCRATGLTEPAGRGRLYADARPGGQLQYGRPAAAAAPSGGRRRGSAGGTTWRSRSWTPSQWIRSCGWPLRGSWPGNARAREEGRNCQALVNMEKQPGLWGEKPPAGLLYCGG